MIRSPYYPTSIEDIYFNSISKFSETDIENKAHFLTFKMVSSSFTLWVAQNITDDPELKWRRSLNFRWEKNWFFLHCFFWNTNIFCSFSKLFEDFFRRRKMLFKWNRKCFVNNSILRNYSFELFMISWNFDNLFDSNLLEKQTIIFQLKVILKIHFIPYSTLKHYWT